MIGIQIPTGFLKTVLPYEETVNPLPWAFQMFIGGQKKGGSCDKSTFDYSRNLNNGLVWYSNSLNVSDHQMAC